MCSLFWKSSIAAYARRLGDVAVSYRRKKNKCSEFIRLLTEELNGNIAKPIVKRITSS